MTSKPVETDVLIVGSGPAGATAAALLGMYGVKHILVTKYGWLADTPRAHITNQRAMEVLRDLGLEEKAVAQAVPQHLMANNVFCESLAGEEFGRLYSWGNHPSRKADYDLASPARICDLPQNFLEPILIEAAGQRGTSLCFNTEFVDLVQDADGVTATVKDRLSGETYQIRAKYLIGADGGRSRVAEVIGLPMEGQMGRAGSMNIIVQADLSKYVAHRPSVLYWVLQPGAEIGDDDLAAGTQLGGSREAGAHRRPVVESVAELVEGSNREPVHLVSIRASIISNSRAVGHPGACGLRPGCAGRARAAAPNGVRRRRGHRPGAWGTQSRDACRDRSRLRCWIPSCPPSPAR